MSERHTNVERAVALDLLRQEQNALEETLREQFLANTFFHDHYYFSAGDAHTFGRSAGVAIDNLASLQQEFMEEKRHKNMGERFALALSPKYFDKIHVVELGLTENPSSDGEIDGLKHEWVDLRHWLESEGLIDGELSREESGRLFEYRRSKAAPDHVVVVRQRPLVLAETDSARVVIFKRMVFAMPELLCAAIANTTHDPELKSEASMSYIEDLMYHKNPLIASIRTGYYLATSSRELEEDGQ